MDDKPLLHDNADKQMEDKEQEGDDEIKERSGDNYDPPHPPPLYIPESSLLLASQVFSVQLSWDLHL